MGTKTLFQHLRNRLREFRTARAANVTVTFALAVVPVTGFVGAAVDYSNANSAKTAMQAATDSTALMLSKDAATLTGSQLNTKATSYFTALFTRPEVTGVTVTPTYTNSSGSQIVVVANGSLKTNFMGLMGFSTLTVATTSTIKWGTSKLRVALALDNTGSMADDGKMTALKSATHQLLTTLQNASSTAGDVQVAIVPFSKDVNVGGTSYNANWIDWSNWEDDNGHDSSSTTCTTTKTGKNGKSTKKCTTSTTWVPDNHNTWNGCITDRDQDYDIKNTGPNPADASLPDSAVSTLFPAEQYGYCPVKMMGQSYNWTAMHALVDTMTPNGNTNQAIGLAWAWHALTDGAPLSPPVINDVPNTQKVIILMSDGLNTEDRWYTDATSINARQAKSCANIKAAGVIVYTLHVNTDGDPTSTVLQTCASDASKFFLVTSASQIVTTFNAIGTNLARLRIAK